MKKKEEPRVLTAPFKGVRLFRDDIEYVIQLMKEHSLEVTIGDSSYNYDSLDDLIQTRGTRPKELICSATGDRKEAVSIELSVDQRGRASLTEYSETGQHLLWYQLRDFLTKSVPWRYRFASPAFWGIAAFSLAYMDLQLLTKPIPHAPRWLHPLVLLITLIWPLTLLDRQLNFGLNLRRQHEGGFWRRNADKIALLIIGALIGAIATLLVQVFTRAR